MDTATFQRLLSGLLLAVVFLPPVKTSSSSSSSFSSSLSNSVYLNASGFLNIPHIWQLRSNSGLSFRTCSNGKLLHQVGATGNSLTLTLNNGVLNFEWQTNSSLSNVTVGEKLNDNAWYYVMFEFLLGNLSIKVQKGSQMLFTKLIANDTLNKDLWSIKLDNGSALQVGFNFIGCLMSGPNIDLATANSTGLVYNSCPSTDDPKCSETKEDFNDCYSYPCQNGGSCVDQDQNYTCSCLTTFTGRNCELNLGNQKCALAPCLNNGTCVNTTNSFKCNCLPGFTGIYCDLNINECETKPCVYGKCIDGINNYTCNCTGSGYKGKTCSDNVNECDELVKPCGGSKCVDTFGSYTCECPEGSAGILCEDINECLSEPCLNGGTCDNLVNKYECKCIKGFDGNRCQTNIYDCAETSCPWNNTVCRDKINNFTCECKPGFTGHVDNCKDIDECLGNPCQNNGSCINLENRYRCDCILGFDGDNCTNNIDDCASAPCQNNATCHDAINNYTCDCVKGFEDHNCNTDIDDCVNNTCQNKGVCRDRIDDYICDCLPGWTGKYCKEEFDKCSLGPCQNGAQCTKLFNDYSCSCLPGYEGKNCSIDINECQINPCQNGGSCTDLVNDYKCNCTLEWMGKNCSEEYDACSFKPCQNNANCSSVKRNHDYNCLCVLGFDDYNCTNNIDDCKDVKCENGTVCFDEVNSYYCACPIGMEGVNCSEDINECDKKPCQNGGTCKNTFGSYACNCKFKIETIENNENFKFPTGYNGTNCENDINECDYRFSETNQGICLYGGTCRNLQGTFGCSCDNSGKDNGKYYGGRNCEMVFDYCTKLTGRCQNGGTCYPKTSDKFICECRVGFTGESCETNVDDCINSPCFYNGTCEDGVNSYTCLCINGTTGRHCETDINECKSNPCKNNGQCKDLMNGYECNCTDTGFTGATCADNIDDCINNSCRNNATCIDGVKEYSCKCYGGYEGENCEKDIDECAVNPCVHSFACLQRSNQSLYGQNLSYFGSRQFSYAKASGYKCLCDVGYEGQNCSIDIDECLEVNCTYGNCINNIGSATCNCSEGYEGEFCDKDIDECSRNYCQHGSECYNGFGMYNCTCLRNPSERWYGGKNCSVELTGCDHKPCLNGTCNPFFDENNSQHYYTCSCVPGFMGKNCQDITTMSFNGSSFLEMKARITDRLIIEFQYQTTLGNVFLSSFALQNTKYLTLQLRQGKLVLTNDTIIIKDFGTANDSTWQFIRLEFISKELFVQTSGTICKFSKCSQKFKLAEKVTGEVSFGKILSNLLPNYKYSSAPFIGCLQDVSINENILLATNASKAENVAMSCPRHEQCFDETCNRRGNCIDLWFQKQCICDRPYLGELCEVEVTAGTFAFNNTLSFSEYNLTTIQNRLQTYLELSFYFITRYGDSQIVYFSESDQTVGTGRSFFSLKLQGGSIVTELKRCNDFFYKTPAKYDDGQKHFLEIKVFLENITLNVDSFNKTHDFGEQCMLNLSTLTVGKKPNNPSSRKRRSTQPTDNFKGILQDMTLNDLSVVFNKNTSNVARLPNTLVPSATANVLSGAAKNDPCKLDKPCGNNSTCLYVEFEDYFCNCSAGFTGKNCTDIDFCYYTSCSSNVTCGNTEDGYECYISVTFNVTSSILYKPNPYINDVHNFSVDFRTREEQGYLFSTIDTATDSNFSVYLHNKSLKLNAGNIVGSSTSENVTDGNWHYFVLAWNESNSWITLDGVELVSISNSSINYTTLFTSNNFTVGDEFVGCMRNLSINGNHIPMLPDTSNSSRSQQYQLLQKNNVQMGCLSKDVCLANNCSNQATCKDVWNKYKCNCPAGYTDEFCGTDIDECSSNPCKNGATCNDSINSYHCVCAKGFNGSICDNNIDECAGSPPCLNNGTCNDLVASYNCSCTNKYTGDNCEYKINETCNSTTCKNGTCYTFNYTDNTGKTFEVFNCTCDTGFEGRECELEKVFCVNNITCSGRGNCSNNANLTGYICKCNHGYEGSECEKKTDYCQDSPCKNNGACKNVKDTYRCDCISGWQGENCTEDINECTNRTEWCQNQGVCTNTPGSFICNCNGSGFAGVFCQCKGPCITDPCKYGTCIQNCTAQNYTCQCSQGFEGENCDRDINECLNSPCQHGSTCKNIDGSYSCNCAENYLGNNCHLEDPCSNNPCQNNGNCSYNLSPDKSKLLNSTCSCLPGYIGITCVAKVTSSETDFYIYIIIGVVLLVLVIIIAAAVTYFLITTRKKRATSGTYSPSRQEMSGSRVELGNVWKIPPTERLI